MVLETIFNLVFGVIEIVIGLFPDVVMNAGEGVATTFKLISYALVWFPLDLWLAILANIIFWLAVQGGWIVIEWVYKKIPGVD